MSLTEPEPNPFSEYDDVRAQNLVLQSEVESQHRIIMRLNRVIDALTESNEMLRYSLLKASEVVMSGASAPVQQADIARDAVRILATLPPLRDS